MYTNFSVYGDSDAITNPDDLLPPIAKLEKYAESDNIFNRSVSIHLYNYLPKVVSSAAGFRFRGEFKILRLDYFGVASQ